MTDALSALLNSDVEQRELDRGGRTLSWFEAGEGTPTIVFEAGAMSPVIGFAGVFQALAPKHRVIAYDRAGYGASDPSPVDLDLQLDDLIAILEEAGPSVLVGHSWGGLLAQLASWARPDLISGLVLVDPSHESIWADLSPEILAELGRHPDRTSPSSDPRSADIHGYARELATDVARSVDAAAPVQELLIAACLSYLETDAQLFMCLDEVPMILDHLDELAVRRSQGVWPEVPIVLLTATKGRPEESTKLVTAIQDEVTKAANGRHLIVPDSGHYIHLDRPDLVIDTIRTVAANTP